MISEIISYTVDGARNITNALKSFWLCSYCIHTLGMVITNAWGSPKTEYMYSVLQELAVGNELDL